MIVITSLNEASRQLYPGDVFFLTVKDEMGHEVIIKEEIAVFKVINFVASYRFALEDGTCPGFHLCGIFANKDELPEEMKKAIQLDDLTGEQYKNFTDSVGIKI